MERYPPEVEEIMKKHYNSLNEKERRTYAAVEVYKLPQGGQAYICELFGCDRKTIVEGRKDLESKEGIRVGGERVRVKGGGNKKTTEKIENINEIFLEIVENHTAGDPMNEGVKWTNLTPKEISQHFRDRGYNVSPHVARQLLKKQILQAESQKNQDDERSRRQE